MKKTKCSCCTDGYVKVCCRCDATKPLTDYYKNAHCFDGYYHACKICHNAQTKAYNEKDRQAQCDRVRAWEAANMDKVMQYRAISVERKRKRRAEDPEYAARVAKRQSDSYYRRKAAKAAAKANTVA